jgi:16S rRNA (guanine966-N2)-methyltransferase
MRIISGKLKGHKIYLPKNKKTRPLKDSVRESLFNLLHHSKKIYFKFEKSNILDLYSGTGSFGLECLSRQSRNVSFVENEMDAIEILRKNIEKFKLKDKTNIFIYDVIKVLEKEILSDAKFDLIFCDPPFKDCNTKKLIELIYNNNLLKKKGIIILHRNKKNKEKIPDFLKLVEERNYGISKIIFGRFLS